MVNRACDMSSLKDNPHARQKEGVDDAAREEGRVLRWRQGTYV